jgi:hypothetical protein
MLGRWARIKRTTEGLMRGQVAALARRATPFRRSHGVPLRSLALFSAILSVAARGLAAEPSSEEARFPGGQVRTNLSVRESIKRLLAERPPIYRIVFQIQNLGVEIKPGHDFGRAEDISKGGSPSAIFESGWSANGFYLRRVGTIEEALNPHYEVAPSNSGAFMGYQGRTFWQISQSRDLGKSTLRDGEDPSSNAVAVAVLCQELTLDQVLNLGIRNMKRGSARWDSDKFAASYTDGILKVEADVYKDPAGSYVTNRNPRIYGELLPPTSGVEVLKIVEGHPGGPQYLLELSYDKDAPLPLNFPNRILRVVTAGGRSFALDQIRIRALEIESPDKIAPAFVIEHFVPAGLQIVLTNGEVYNAGANGFPSPVPVPSQGTALGTPERHGRVRWLILECICGVSALFAIYLLRSARKGSA